MRRLLASVAATALLAIHMTPDAAHAAEPSIEDVPSAITDLLRDYGRAYVDHDPSLLGKVVAPQFLAPERRALDNARLVPFESFDVRVTTQYSGDLASDRVRARYRGLDVRTYHVTEETRIGDETDAYEEDGAFTFVRSGGGDYDGWRLAAKDDMDVLGFFSPYHLWDEDEVVVLTSRRFLLLTHPKVADTMRPVLEFAESAYDRSDAFWPGTDDDRYVIIVPATTAELGRILHETVDLSKFVAFVAAGSDRSEGWVPTGPRVFVHLSHLLNYSADGKREILAHELLHAITRPVTGPHVPVWVEEGLANLGGGTGGRPSVANSAPVPDEFPTRDLFVTGPVRNIQATYDQAQVAIEVLVDEFGEEGLRRYYEALGKRRVVPGTEEYHVKQAVAESLDWTYDEWVAAWHKRLG